MALENSLKPINRDIKMLANKKILIVGVIRNGENTLASEISSLQNAFCDFLKIHWLVIESDSEDNTVKKLSELSQSVKNFNYKSAGRLAEQMPLRTERLAFCRNIYLNEIRSNPFYNDFEYIAVADLDGVNNLLTQDGVRSCFEKNIWDVCTANQLGNYYDVWALRHRIWSPGDCWEQYRYLNQFAKSPQESAALLFAAVHSKMVVVPMDAEWIEVESAFGGLAIYKRETLLDSNTKYIGLNKSGVEIVDHASLHLGITQNGYKIFINPKLINTDFTEHSIGFKPKSKSLLYV
jgi:hypothetical protein